MQERRTLRRRLAQGLRDMREYERIAGFWEIARRALANNAFDGILTTIGLLMGSYLAGVRSASVVIHTGIATSIAMGVSGLWGAYLAESAERGRDMADLERLSLAKLHDSKIGRASRTAIVVVSVVDGLAPFVSSLIVLVPMFAAPLIGNIVVSYALSVALAMVGLFGLGMFLGSISRRSLIGYGLRTVVAGVVCVALIFLLGLTTP